MDGFEAPDREIPTPPVNVSDATRARMINVLVAVVHGATPEDVAGHLEDGFPADITDALERPGELDEMNAHLDLLLSAQQSPAPVAV